MKRMTFLGGDRVQMCVQGENVKIQNYQIINTLFKCILKLEELVFRFYQMLFLETL